MPVRSHVKLTKTAVESAPLDSFLWDVQVPGFGVRVTASGKRTFVLQFRMPSGRQGRHAIGPFPAITVQQAREKAQDIYREIRDGVNPSEKKRETRNPITLADLADQYHGPYAKAVQLRPSTIKNSKAVMRLAISLMANRPMREITASDIRKLLVATLDGCEARGRKGYGQANRLLTSLSKMFNIAIENGWASENPCRFVKKFPIDERWRNLSEDEVRSLLQACDRDYDQWQCNVIRLLLFTGARLQEVIRAEWKQFDLTRGIWERPSSHTKTHRLHRIELEGAPLTLLREMHTTRHHDAFLFPGQPKRLDNGSTEIKPQVGLQRCWKRIVAASGISNIRLHDLRRTTASFMLSDGASLATVGKTLGQTQPSTTARYAHLKMDVQRTALAFSTNRMARLAILSDRSE